MGIRTFFLQPFKIPTGSMQPTLYGITHENLINEPDLKVPSGLANFYESWVHGISYYHEVATADGELKSISPPKKLIFFNLWQNFQVGDTSYTVWFPPDDLMQRAGLASASRNTEGQMFFYPNPVSFKAGQDIMKLQVITGDHLFVDRVTYNFRRPQRGEVIVFETKDIPELVRRSQDKLFYIKRMVAMGGDKVQIGDDNHLIINGTRLDANTPHFERVYHFDINKPQRGSYYGHAGGAGAARAAEILKDTNLAGLAPNFPTSNAVLELPPHTYLAMGDNTLSSSDSRDWGTLPQHNVIGKSFFVYWPFTKRFGWEHLATK
jgi:signal peptidase I